jgi:hypothetical protein
MTPSPAIPTIASKGEDGPLDPLELLLLDNIPVERGYWNFDAFEPNLRGFCWTENLDFWQHFGVAGCQSAATLFPQRGLNSVSQIVKMVPLNSKCTQACKSPPL